MWVFNPETKKCTLKKAGNAWNPQILAQGDRVRETSGSLFDLGKKWVGPGEGTIHTVLTSNGNSYMNWQARGKGWKSISAVITPIIMIRRSGACRKAPVLILRKRHYAFLPPLRRSAPAPPHRTPPPPRAVARDVRDVPEGGRRAHEGVHPRASPPQRRRADDRGALRKHGREGGGED